MSKHWNSDGTPWVTRNEFRTMSRAQVRRLYAERHAVKLRNQRSEAAVAILRPQLRRQVVVTVLLGAAFVGVLAGAVLF